MTTRIHNTCLRYGLLWLCGLVQMAAFAPAAAEAPTGQPYKAQAGPYEVGVVECLMLTDSRRKKSLELRVQCPVRRVTADKSDAATSKVEPERFGLIIFSHGAGGSKDNGLLLTQHWVTHGYITIQPTHDDSVRLRRRRGEDYSLLDAARIAMNDSQAWQDRACDISFVLDSLTEIEKQVQAIQGRIDRRRIGMSGHSFGATATMYLAGAKIALAGKAEAQTFGDERISAFLALSPQGPGRMGFTEGSWSDIRLPVMLMTGSRDSGGRPKFTPQWRLIPFERMPPGGKYLLWVEGADHRTFGCDAQRTRRLFPGAAGEQLEQQERYVQFVKIGSIAYWDAYLKNDAGARSYLHGSLLEQYSKGLAKLTTR